MWMTWREAMRTALYGPAGFYARGEPPSGHFRTSAHVSSAYAGAMLRLLREAAGDPADDPGPGPAPRPAQLGAVARLV